MNREKKILAGLMAAAVVMPAASGTVSAKTYHADSDTGIQVLDYIENEHRQARKNRLTDEQKKLLADAKDMEKHLRHPLDKTKPSPVAFEGDDLTYDERDGSFIAKGKVDILQMDAHRFQGENVTGNVKTQDIEIPEKAHVLQMTPGQMRITLDGYKAHYNYGKKTGTMVDVKGKADAHFITAKRFEFYPDHFVAYDATETECSAKKPDYHFAAKKITIYPQQKMMMDNVKLYLKGTPIFSRKHYEKDITPGAAGKENFLPRIGYNNDDKLYLRWDLEFPLQKNLSANANVLVTAADGWRSNYDLTFNNGYLRTGVAYGYFEDNDDRWLKKEPSYFLRYSDHLAGTHFTYSAGGEYGRWYENGIHSNHGEYGVGLGYDPIKFHRYTLYLDTGYTITRESYDKSRVSGMKGSAVLTKDFNDRWAAYTGYHYDKKNSQNTLFNYDTDDFSKKLQSGFSYRIDDRNRLAVGTKYDLDHSKWKNVDYYWFHDLHCSEIILRYKSMSNRWSVRWQFTPW